VRRKIKGGMEPPMAAKRSPNGVTVCPLLMVDTWYNFPAAEAASMAAMGLESFAFLVT
jgi:hypothetical protein